ncbi:hypothetical protein V7S43_017658 [Phytophthora oleae]|uniref:Retrovirus-related Pol polyprotein from transposon TNT 1-94-like beta-barrel domain-containing protein n=1 Tax=Phytophthora oleae TaxID=2107226 RepID=A0ABD3EW59_9STRA
MEKDCPKKTAEPSSAPGKKQAAYTRRVRKPSAEKQKTTTTAEGEAPVKETKPKEKTRRGTEPHSSNMGLSVDKSAEDYAVWEWCFDNAANVYMASDRRYFTEYKTFDKNMDCVRGFKKKFAATPVEHGTVQVGVKRGDLDVILTLRDALHVPDSKNCLSHSQAEDQGYAVEYHGRSGEKVYEIWKGEENC